MNNKLNVRISSYYKLMHLFQLHPNLTKEKVIQDCSLPYNKVLLFENSTFELVILYWTPGQFCLPHSHGPESVGFIKVLQGEGINREFSNELVNKMKIIKEQKIVENQVVVANKDVIHQMGSSLNKPLISLHLYTPLIKCMQLFDLQRKLTCWVNNKSGAWWPKDPSNILSIQEY